jgi:hypothetical protein
MNRFTVCLVLPFVIWGASKVDTDLAFACFCSALFYVMWAVGMAIHEGNERTYRDIEERNELFRKEHWFHKREQSPPKEF